MKLSILLVLMILSIAISFASEVKYDDPRGRYTITIPDGWILFEDGKRDVFSGKKGDDTAYFTFVSFPPLEEGKTVDDYMKSSIDLINPTKINEQSDIEISGIKGKMIDILKDFTLDNKKITKREKIYILFRNEEVLTITLEADNEKYSLFDSEFNLFINTLKITSVPFLGALYIDPKGYYSIQLPYNWGIGPGTDDDIYFAGTYEKGIAFCDIDHLAKPVETSDINPILDYWRENIKDTGHDIIESKTGLTISSQNGALLKHSYINEDGKLRIVDDYIFIKDSYLFVISFECDDDFYKSFSKDFDFILNKLKIEI